ncbi:MAG TPA: sigma-70 family RNA polymerase sigma factor [Dehalococcoidia bacterium]|nr:sigma-70 family RNA polymerase sigma factor [Dehalococcoidia bacterium]
MTTLEMDSDAALIAAYHSGEDAALTALVQRHQAGVYRLALGVLASPQDAEDATQEALIAMFSSLPRFRGDSAFATWLYRLTLNTCLKRRSRRAGRREEPLLQDDRPLPDSPDPGPDVHAGRRWLRERVAGFLSALPDTYRIPVVLTDALEMPASEIAVMLGLSLPAVKARILRGRERLRAEIERYCQEAGLSGWRELLT